MQQTITLKQAEEKATAIVDELRNELDIADDADTSRLFSTVLTILMKHFTVVPEGEENG